MKMKIIKPEDSLEKRPIMAVIYGAPGLGKTTAAFTFPNPLLIDTDRGIGRAEQSHRCTSVNMETWRDFDAIVDDIESGAFKDFVEDNGIETIVIDTGGTLLDDYMSKSLINENSKNALASGTSLSLQGWGALSSKFGWLKSEFLSMGLNLVVICHVKESEEAGVSPQMKGSSATILYQNSDLMGYMIPEKGGRYIDFRPSINVKAKNTGEIGKVKVPKVDSPDFLNFGTMLINKVHSNINKKTIARKILQEKITSDAINMDSTKTLEELFVLAPEIEEMTGVRKQFAEEAFIENMKVYLEVQINSFKKNTQYTKLAVQMNDYPKFCVRPAKKFLLDQASLKGYEYSKESDGFVKVKAKKNEEAVAN